MKLAIQEDMLHGYDTQARFALARNLGFDGVEVWADGLSERIMPVAQAADAAGIAISGVNLSQQAGYIAPDLATREAAISRMRQAMANAIDLQAPHVIFTPHNQPHSAMPDLTPYRSPHELAQEMMIWLLRTVSDLAYALGATLYMQPTHRYHSSYLNTLAHAAQLCEVIKDHPHIRIAAHSMMMAYEELDLYASLDAHLGRIGYLHIGDSNHGLPTRGIIDWGRIAAILHQHAYDGWVVISAGTMGANHANAADYAAQLPTVLEKLRAVGIPQNDLS